MKLAQAIEIVKDHLPEKRFQHVISVVETAHDLAERFGADVAKAELAAAFHDYLKYETVEYMREIIMECQLPQDLLTYHEKIWHGPCGAEMIKKRFAITDEEILDAIRYHTTGRANMTLLDKIVYLADYIEPGRKTPGLDKCRELATTDLDLAVLYALGQVIAHLETQGAVIHPDTKAAYDDLFLAKQSKSKD